MEKEMLGKDPLTSPALEDYKYKPIKENEEATGDEIEALKAVISGKVKVNEITTASKLQHHAFVLTQQLAINEIDKKLQDKKYDSVLFPGIDPEKAKNNGLKYDGHLWITAGDKLLNEDGVSKQEYDTGYNDNATALPGGILLMQGLGKKQVGHYYWEDANNNLHPNLKKLTTKYPGRILCGKTSEANSKQNPKQLTVLGVHRQDFFDIKVGEKFTPGNGGQMSDHATLQRNELPFLSTTLHGVSIDYIMNSTDPVAKNFQNKFKKAYEKIKKASETHIKKTTDDKKEFGFVHDPENSIGSDGFQKYNPKDFDKYDENKLNYLANGMSIQEGKVNDTEWLASQHVNGALGNVMLKPQKDEGKCNTEKVAFFIGSIGGDHTTKSKILNTLTSMKNEFIKNNSAITNIKSATEDVKKAMEAVKKAMKAVSDEINKLHILNEGNAFENKNSIRALCNKIPDGLGDINRQIDQMKEPEVDEKKNQDIQSVIQNQVDGLIEETNNADWHLRVKDDLAPSNFNYYTDPLPNLNDTFYIFGPLNYTANHYATFFIEVTEESFNVHSYSGDITADRITEMRQRLIDSHYFDSLDADTAKVEKAIKAKKIQNIKSKIMIDGTEVENATGKCGDASIFLTIIIQWLLYTKRKVNDWGNVNITSEEAKQALQACYNKNLVDECNLYTDKDALEPPPPYETDNNKFAEGMREYYYQCKKFNPNQLQRTFKDEDIDTFLNNINKKNENIGAVCRRFFLKTKVLEATNEYILANRQDFSKQDIKKAEDAIKKAQEKENPPLTKKLDKDPLQTAPNTKPQLFNPDRNKSNDQNNQDASQLNNKLYLTQNEVDKVLKDAFDKTIDTFYYFALKTSVISQYTYPIMCLLKQKIKLDELSRIINNPHHVDIITSFYSHYINAVQLELREINYTKNNNYSKPLYNNKYPIHEILQNNGNTTITTYIQQNFKYKPKESIFANPSTTPLVVSKA